MLPYPPRSSATGSPASQFSGIRTADHRRSASDILFYSLLFIKTECKVRILQRLTGRALEQIVNDGQDRGVARGGIDRAAEVAERGARRKFELRQLRAGEDADVRRWRECALPEAQHVIARHS